MAELDGILKTTQSISGFTDEEIEILHFLESLILSHITPTEKPRSALLPDCKLQKKRDHISLICCDGCMNGMNSRDYKPH